MYIILWAYICLVYAFEHVLFMFLYIAAHTYVTQSIQMPKHYKYTYNFIQFRITYKLDVSGFCVF